MLIVTTSRSKYPPDDAMDDKSVLPQVGTSAPNPMTAMSSPSVCMTYDRPRPSTDSGRVVQSRPRKTSAGRQGRADDSRSMQRKARSPVEGLEEYQRANNDDGYHHRMTMNALALAICVLLIVAALWLAKVIVDVRKLQDCVLSGRVNCVSLDGAVAVPH